MQILPVDPPKVDFQGADASGVSTFSKVEPFKTVENGAPQNYHEFQKIAAKKCNFVPNKTGFDSVLLKPKGAALLKETEIKVNQAAVLPTPGETMGENGFGICHSLAFSYSCKTYHRRQDPERDKPQIGIFFKLPL